MEPMTVGEQRALSAIERDVVTHEFRQSARGMRYMGWFIGAAAVFVAGFAPDAIRIGSWLMTGFVFIFAGSCAWMSYLLLKRRASTAPLELAAVRVHALCATRRHGKHSYAYVGPCRVFLRDGWQVFWPEGKTVDVELCLPPANVGTTWVDASIVSLPGIDITSWHKLPPPKSYVWLTIGALLTGLATLMLTLVLSLDDYWPRAASGLRNTGKVLAFEGVGELRRTPRAVGARVTIEHGYWVRLLERGDYLCELTAGWARDLATATIGPAPQLREPTDAEVDAHLDEHCDPSELATRMKKAWSSVRDHPISETQNPTPPGREASSFERAARERCRAITREALRADQTLAGEMAVDERLAREVVSNPENTCVLADSASLNAEDERRPVAAFDDEVGVLGSDLVWRSGAPGPNLKPLWALVIVWALAVVTIIRAVWRARRHGTELDAWAKAVRLP